ncbi:MAG TPA: flagellar hook-associated protein FlgK, partial [Malonomonas sp.]
ISAIEAAGQDANSDRDRRDLLLKELSGIIGASTFETSNGTATVQLGNGMPLVEGTQVTRIQAVASGVDTNLELAFGTTTLPLGRSALGGEFGGLYQARDVMIPDVVNRLDQLAFTFANSINAQHQAGTGLDGVAGRDFFVAPVAVAGSASSLSMSITATAELAAGASISPGDNTNALAILQLEQQQLLGNDTFVSYYGKIAATVGVETARNRQAKQGFEDSLIQLQNLRDGLDGVSIEDEMINLLQYQKGFEASAKFLSTVDEMMDTLLTLKR